jgi:hypothetical protein
MNLPNLMKTSALHRCLSCIALTTALSSAAAGTDVNSSSESFKKPVWLMELSLGVKEGYDDNVFLVSGKGASARDSWVNTVSPRIGINFAPLLRGQSAVQVLSLGYTADVVSYNNEPTENYTAHRLSNVIKGKASAITFNLDNSFLFVDGSRSAATYSTVLHDDQRNAYATAVPRERRKQIQDRAKLVFQYDVGSWFVRPTASLLYYDLMTDLRTDPGYQNYADRSDLNGGVDFGRKITPALAVTLGYRYGHQSQKVFPFAIDKTQSTSPSDYQRALLGLEGKLLKWLTLSAQAGPDFRTYPASTTTRTTPVDGRHLVKYYGEASLTATPTPNDTLSFKYKQWQWESSTGKVAAFDSSYDLSYQRKLNKKLSADLGLRLSSLDYTCGTGNSSKRYDRMITTAVGLSYNFTTHLSANLAYTIDLGRNLQDNLDKLSPPVDPKYREFGRHLISVGVAFKI